MLSREEINKKLEQLRVSKLGEVKELNDDELSIPTAMCYAMVMPRMMTISRFCSHCKRPFEFCAEERKNIYYDYEDIVNEFFEAGVVAELNYICPECAEKLGHDLEMKIAYDADNYKEVISYPKTGRRGTYNRKNRRYGSDIWHYEYALKFLKGDHTYSSLTNGEYVLKFPIDMALYRVLGLEITYSIEEAIWQFNAIVKRNIYAKGREQELTKSFNEKIKAFNDSIKLLDFEEIVDELLEGDED